MKPCFFFSTKLPRYAVKIGCFITNLFSEQNNRLLVVNTIFSDGGYIYICYPHIYISTGIYIYIYTHNYTYSERFAIRSDLHSGFGSIPTSGSRNGWRKRASAPSPHHDSHHTILRRWSRCDLQWKSHSFIIYRFTYIYICIYIIYIYVYMYIYMYIYIGIFYMRIYNYDNIVGDTG